MRISDWSSDVCSSDLTGGGDDPAHDIERLALHTIGDIRARFHLRRIGDEEGPKYGRLGHAFGHAVVDRVDEHADAEDIRQQNIFLPLVVAALYRAGDRKSTRLNSSN